MSQCCSIPWRAVLVLALGVAIGCDKLQGTAARVTGGGPAPAPVTVGSVELRDVPVQIRPIATVEAFASVTIQSRVSGQLQKIHVSPGQDVKAGDLLFEIDPRPFEIALHEAQARLARDEALAKNAQIDAERMAGLRKNNVATQEEADKMRFAAEAANATVRGDQSAVENAELNIAYTKIRSPVDGRAGSYLADVGNVIKEDDTPLLVINQIQPIYVSFALPEQDLELVKRHMQPEAPMVDVILPPDTTPSESGRLTFIDNRVDPDTGTIRMRATFENQSRRLWPGQFVQQAILKLTVEKNQPVVPTRAIQAGQTGIFVFVVKDDQTVEMRSVKVKRDVGDDSVIESGLTGGEKIVLDGQLRLVPGAKITIVGAPTSAPSPNSTASAVLP